MEFTATLTTAVSAKVTATWTASIESGDTASAADLATTTTGEVEFDANATEAKFTVPVNDDTTDEDNETFTVTLSNPSSNAQLATDPTAKGTINDDDDEANTSPSFSSSATISVAENDTSVGLVRATDSDADDSVTGYAITGGADQTLFRISGPTGLLVFGVAKDYEDPQDSGTDNTYVVDVTATSGTGTRVMTATQTITVTVTNVDEGQSGTVTIDDTMPMVGDELTASTANAADPDGLPDPFAPTWKWYRTPDGGSETEITGETSATYTVVAAHLGATLTAKASWTDKGGFANTLSSAPTSAVAAAPSDDCPANTTTTCEVDVGGSAMGNIDSETDVDWFRIDLVSDTRYQFDLEGDDTTRGNLGDPYLQLANSLGNVLGGTQNRDSGVGDNARVIWTPANIGNDLVYLIVEGAANTTGTYTLSVIVLGANGASEADTDCPATTATTCQVEVGASATGNVGTNGDQDWFKVVLEADKTYQIDLKGQGGGGGTLTDPELPDIRDSSGDEITDTGNDDADADNDVNDSRIVFTPTTASTYYLVASDAYGTITGTYTLSVRDVTPTDATLSALSLGTGVTLDPSFDSDTYAYAASVANSVEEVTVTPATTDSDATFEYLDSSDAALADADTNTAGHQVDLDVGDTVFKVKVTAEDDTTTQTYTVTVTRACALNEGDIWCGVVTVGDVTNNDGDTIRNGFVGTTGGLTDETFSLMFETGTNNNYTISAIVVDTSEQLYFVTSSGLTDTEEESLALHVDGESAPFVFSDTTQLIAGSYRWPARTDLDWSSEPTVTLRLREFPRPTVTNVAVTSTPALETDTYGADETIEVSVTFSEAVNATSDTDFVLSVAGAKRAPLLRGSGTATLVFGYTVVSSDEDTNGIWIGNETRTLDGNRGGEPQNGTITSVATGAAANLDHDDLGTDSDHKVDGSRTTDNVAPSFSSSATISVAENQTTVVTVLATDSDAGDKITGYALTGGADQGFFSIGGALGLGTPSGDLTFDAAPNYEDAEDQGTDNTYVVEVTATSGTGTRVKTATQTITVTVTDVDEGQSGTVTIDDTAPMVGDELTASTASVADPDGLPDPFAPTWKWYRTPDGGSETEITGETSATYTVVAADLGATLTAKASWTDNGGFANTLSSAPTGAVAAASTLPTLSISDAEGNEGLNIFFLVTLSATASQNATVTCTASFETGDTAAAADLSTTTGTATINAGTTTGTCAIATVQDTIDEDNETFTVTLSNTSSNAQLATDPTAKGTILDDDPPVLSFKQVSYTAAEGGSAVEVELMLTSALPGTLRVTITAEHGAGATAEDYTGISDGAGAIFTAGQTRSVFEVTAFDDAFDEADETVTFGFTIPSSAVVTKGSVSEATLTLTDNDDPPTVSVADVSGTEGTALTFTVTLSDESGKTVTVDYATSVETGDTATSGTDFTAKTSTTLTFDPGQEEKTFTVQTTDDTDIEGDETFTVTLSNPSNATISDTTAKGTINDDDATDDCPATTTTTCEVDVGGSATGTSESAGDFDWFRVVLEADTRYQIDLEGAATVRGTLANPAVSVRDASATNLASDDNSGVGNNARVIYTPTAAGTYYVQASGLSGPGLGTYTVSVIVLGANGASEADTDFPIAPQTTGRVEVGASATGTIDSAGDFDWFKVVLEAGKTYQIDMKGVDGGGGTLADPYLHNIRDSESEEIDDTGNDDIGGEDDIRDSQITFTPTDAGAYYLVAAPGGSAPGTYTLSVRDTTTVTLPTLSVANGSATEGAVIAFPLTLTAAASAAVTVTCTASIESSDTAVAADLLTTTSTATINVGSTAATCPIATKQDSTDEDNETFTVTLSNTSSNAQLATDPTAKGTINDDDDPPTLSVGDVSGTEGTALTFTVTLSDESGKTVTVDYATSAETGDTATSGTDFTAKTSTTLTFDPGQEEKTFTVQTTDDTDIEGDETFTVTLSNPSNATISDTTAKGTINDDDAALDVLVSNYPDGSGSDFSLHFVQSGNSQRHYIAQTFTAGAGFTLTAVDIPFRRVPDNSRVTVSLHALNGSKPGTYLAGLDLSGALAVGDNTFAAPAGTALAAGSYFVRVRWRSGDTNNLLMTDGPDDETSAESGWSIEDRSQYSASGSSWSNWNQQFAMRVRGTIDGVPRVATGGVRIESDPDAHDSYGVGEEIEVAVGFTDDVTVDTPSGTPRVELTVGSNTRYADYSASDSSADELAFLYEVTADDHDQDGVSIDADALELNGGAIHKDGDTSTNAVLDHAALDADSDHRVNRDPFIVSDGVSVISDPQAAADTYGLGEVIEIEVEFSAAVDATTGTDFVLSVAGAKRAPLLRGSGTKKLVFGYTVVASDDDDSGIWIGDQDRTLVGNRNGDPQNGEITSAVTDRAADLDHDSPGVLSGHKVDGSRTTGNVAPSFTSDATISVAENETAVVTVAATDSDADDSVTGYAITGGADMALFEIGATSGELTFKSAPNFEDAQDQGTNNTYVVVVTATSGAGTRVKTATQTITVTVTDVDTEAPGKPGTPTVSAGSATSLRVNWSAPDNAGPAITDYDYRHRITSPQGSWTEVTGTTITTLSATIGSLAENTSYDVQVRATNAEGTGSWSDSGSGTTVTLPTLSIGNASATEGSLISFPLTLSATASENVTVTCTASLASGDTGETDDLALGSARDGIVLAGQTAGICTIPTSSDTTDEDDETFTVTLSNVSSNAQLAADPTAKGTIENDDDCPGDATTTCEVDVGGSVTGTLETDIDEDDFKVDLEAGTRYQFDLEGVPTSRGTLPDPLLEIRSPANLPLSSDDDSGVGLNSRVIYTPTATGTYYLKARKSTTPTGTYTVSVIVLGANGNSEADTDFPATTATTGRVEVGASATGNIESGTDVDRFKVDLEAGKRYQFKLEGSHNGRGTLPDPSLSLYDGSDNLITNNDDISPTNPNSEKLQDVTATGTYYLEAKGARAAATGTYTLSVNDVTPPSDDNVAPSFSSSAARNVAENTTAVVTVLATDSDTADSVTGYAITGGADQGLFSIGATSGVLTFDAAPNFEDPKDSHNDNDYVVVVQATSGMGTREMTATQTITVTVTDMSGEAPGKPAKPRVSAASATSLRVNWSAPSNAGPAITDYDVQYRAGDSGGWSDASHTGTARATTLTGLTEDTSYQVQVRAKNAEGTGAWSDSGSGTPAEEDDLPANTSTSAVVEVGGSAVRGDIHEPVFVEGDGPNEVDGWDFDTDWFAVELEEGRTYRIDMKGQILSSPGLDTPGEPVDPELTLSLPQINAIYDADGGYLFNTWSSDESDSHHLFRVTFHAHAGGAYYIAASGESHEWGGYELTVIDITRDVGDYTNVGDDTNAQRGLKNLRAVEEQGGVRLTWQPPDGAAVTGYRIERRRADGQDSGPQRSHGQPGDHHTLVEDTGNTETSYVDESAEQGVEYEYRVTARNESGPGEESDWVRAGPEEEPVWGDGLPGAPRNLTATPGNREVSLSWDPPDDNGNALATRYRIEWRVDGKDYDRNDWGTAQETTYTTNDQANLANGVKYFFRVKAENDDGNSYGPYGPASEEVSATPTSGSAVDLGTPVLSDTEILHHGMVQLDWQDIEDAGWYVVQYYHLEDGEWLDLPAEGVDIALHGSSAVVSNLHGLSWLRVGAASCDGASEWSQIEELYGTNASDWKGVPVPEVAEGDEIEPCPVVLGTPVLSDTETLHHGMVQLDWQDIEDAGWYVVQYYHLEDEEWLDLPAEGVDIAFHGSSAVVSNLHGLSWLRVGAASCDGESEWSQIEELYGTNASDWKGVPVPEVAEGDEIEPCSEDADTLDNSPATGAPTITGTAQVGETLTADTSGIADADGLSNVQYEYQWLADNSEISGATNATYTLTDSEESKAVKVQVSFTDDEGNEETLTSTATGAVAGAQPTEPPDKPTGLEATASHDSVVLTWDDPGDDSITGYVILRRIPGVDPEGQFSELVSNTGTDATTYTDGTVSVGTTYTYRIKAINEHGVSERSRWSHINVPAAPEAAEGDVQDGEGDDDGSGAPGQGTKANVPEGGTDCTAGTDTTCMVEVGGSATGEIDPVADVDWFRVVLEAGKFYRIDLEGTETSAGTLPNPYLTLSDSTGQNILSDDDGGDGANSRLEYTATANGIHYLEAWSSGFTESDKGTYTLSVREAAPPSTPGFGEGVADLLSNLEQMTSSNSSAGIETYDGAQGFTTGRERNGYFLDSITLDVKTVPKTPADVSVELWSASSGNPDASIATLTHATGTWATGDNTFDAPPGKVLAAETKYFVVVSYSGDRPGLDLQITTTRSADDTSTNWTVTGKRLERQSGNSGSWAGVTITQYLKFSVSAATVPGQVAAEGDTDLPADVTTKGVLVADGFAVRGAIDEPDFVERTGSNDVDGYEFDTDWFAVDLTAGRTYRIDMRGAIPTNDLTLRLPEIEAIYDADSNYLANTSSRDATDDANSSHHLARVEFTPHEDGTYYIAATGESFEWGGYELTVIDITRDADKHPAGRSTTAFALVDTPVTGKIDFNGDVDWFQLNIRDVDTYQIDLEGQATGRGSLRDPLLWGVYDEDGNYISGTGNDDGGEGYNARITRRFEVGIYYISVGAFGNYEGTYTLSVGY